MPSWTGFQEVLGDGVEYTPLGTVEKALPPNHLRRVANELLYHETKFYLTTLQKMVRDGAPGVSQKDVDYYKLHTVYGHYQDRRRERDARRREDNPDADSIQKIYRTFLDFVFTRDESPAGKRMLRLWQLLKILKLEDELIWSTRISDDDPEADFTKRDILTFMKAYRSSQR